MASTLGLASLTTLSSRTTSGPPCPAPSRPGSTVTTLDCAFTRSAPVPGNSVRTGLMQSVSLLRHIGLFSLSLPRPAGLLYDCHLLEAVSSPLPSPPISPLSPLRPSSSVLHCYLRPHRRLSRSCPAQSAFMGATISRPSQQHSANTPSLLLLAPLLLLCRSRVLPSLHHPSLFLRYALALFSLPSPVLPATARLLPSALLDFLTLIHLCLRPQCSLLPRPSPVLPGMP